MSITKAVEISTKAVSPVSMAGVSCAKAGTDKISSAKRTLNGNLIPTFILLAKLPYGFAETFTSCAVIASPSTFFATLLIVSPTPSA
ncbi:MAG: hypothetical protein QXO16_01360 [Archaeoglobaceae archaeon]